ncbi:hypothetical protein [Pedomonas mirosovicensis]|uniref:hypothetical protein n=1 Tax=Pedomonas mirosovicensis TaxID=2908641 RepID=UPI00216925C4|nr:hypothetical protein [Pedomonas mirosovicensis]MCH8684313.1 hypothetical protein [Pedomonas mirosovicensis]
MRLSGQLDRWADFSWQTTRAFGLLPGLGFHRYILTAVPRQAMPAMPRGYTVETLSAAQCAGMNLGTSPEAVAYRLSMGCDALAAFNRKDQLVGVFWLTASPFREDEIDLWYDTQGQGAWDLGLYVPPEHRATRAFAALWAGAGAWLDARGLGWSFSRITDYNAASLSAHARLQGWRLGTVWAISMGQWQLTGSSLLERPHWHRVGGNAPVIRLAPPLRAV